jgi:prepilin-type N-terminal cleavage/methylation domain-containing protein/prepilin-type processing-associated H-X9-DG protein
MPRRPAFTLIELMFVIAIIGILVSLLLPAIQSSREQARRTQCANNLSQLGIALASYESTHLVLPPGVVDPSRPILNLVHGYHHGWAVQILPFLEQGNVYRRFRLEHGVYEPTNFTARNALIATFRCPSDGVSGPMSYAGCHHDVEAPIDADNHGVLFLNSHVRDDDITDGRAYTILLGELRQGGPTLGWASGTRSSLRNTGSRLNAADPLVRAPGPRVPNPVYPEDQVDIAETLEDLVESGALPVDRVGGFSSHHPGAANFLFCDGSIRLIRQQIDVQVYGCLGHRADGGLISTDAY